MLKFGGKTIGFMPYRTLHAAKSQEAKAAALRNLERSAPTSVRSKCAVRLLTPGTRSVPEFVADAGPNPQATIAAIEDEPLWFLVSLQHDQLMAQCDDLDLQYRASPKAQKKGIEKHLI